MDNYRLLLFVALAFIVMMIYQAWEEENRVTQAPAPAASSTPSAPASGSPSSAAGVPSAPPAPTAPVPFAAEAGEQVTVTTDLVRADINTQGGDIRRLLLLQHPVSVDKPKEPFTLFQESATDVLFAQSGMVSHGPDSPTHKVKYTTTATAYVLAPNADSLRVPLTWRGPGGVRFTKVFVFHRGSYVIDVDFQIDNPTAKPWSGYFYGQLQRSYVESGGLFALPTYTGAAIYTPAEKYGKVSFDDMDKKPLATETTDGWVAMLQHYFVGAWVPQAAVRTELYSQALPDRRYVIGVKNLVATEVAPGASATVGARLFAGPKEHKRLSQVAPGLELTVDYGWLTVISAPLFWLLSRIHGLIGNWGWSIILLTVLIKLVFYPLSATSYKSMANMKKLQPKLQSLKERFGDDRQKLNQAMMELYKTEKINPLGGCLPIVVQIPVFLALYWVLLESVELRQTPFIFWIRDLSTPDPYFVLPIVMGLSMYVQQLLNPQPPDPMQRRIFMVMPVAFTVMFLFFPAGLVLYWVVNNVLSILQQWRITRVVAAKSNA
ncbi:MAG TPA: membrane protein insertase YidC [Burkholderiales bacterium]